MEKCLKCDHNMKKIRVEVEGTKNRVDSYQCPKCGFFEFEGQSSKKVIEELKEKECTLNIKQKIIKLSKDRLGLYINSDIVRCLNLKSGQDVYTCVPNKRTIVLTIK